MAAYILQRAPERRAGIDVIRSRGGVCSGRVNLTAEVFLAALVGDIRLLRRAVEPLNR